MASMVTKLRPQGTRSRAGAALSEQRDSALLKSVRENLEIYLKGRKLLALKPRQVEGNNVEGILKMRGTKGELQMVDFKATSTPQGGLSSLEVGGRKISLGQSRDKK